MIDITKHLEFFNPIEELHEAIHIIGVGAIGSTLAEMLARLGIQKLYLYDFDTVCAHNIANQMFYDDDIGKTKLEAISATLKKINPDIEIKEFSKGYFDQPLAGYVFLAVDDIDLRRQIATDNQFNPHIKAMFDFRMGLSNAQHYAAVWNNKKSVETFIQSMAFTHEEAKQETPISACGTTLSVIPTVRIIVSYGVSNFINFVKTATLKKFVEVDAFSYLLDVFS